MLNSNNSNNSSIGGLAQSSVVFKKPKYVWEQNSFNTQQSNAVNGGADNSLVTNGFDASNIAVTGGTTSTSSVAAPAKIVTPVAPTVGLAAGNGLGDYGYFTGTDGVTTGLSKEAFSVAEDAGTSGVSRTRPPEQGIFDVAPGAQTSKFASTLGGIGSGVQGLAALGSMYYQGKNYKLQKEAAELEKDRYNRAVKADKAATENKQKFAANVGGGATYVG